jgi:uncharacterized protein YprB with RNaseH-like and TPR domain
MTKIRKPKILFFDIESLPNQGFIWNTRDPVGQHMITKGEAILTIGYKWAGKKGAVLVSKRPYDDKEILREFLKIWADADYVVGHYSDKFDIKYLAYRLLLNGLPPLPDVKSIDTYKMAKRHFKFVSNRLDFIGKALKVGRKNPMSWSDWESCASGNAKAIEKMAKYNYQDVALLEKVFFAMLPHCHSTVLNHNLFSDSPDYVCPGCGSCRVQRRGRLINKTATKTRFQCQDCGQWSSIKER